MSQKQLREQIIAMLTAKNAHVRFEEVASGFPADQRGMKPAGASHTAWQLLEHLRIAQYDILEFSRNADYESPSWPDGYWPEDSAPPDDGAWDRSVEAFKRDLEAVVDLVKDEGNDLFEPFAHGDGQTLLREALLLAKHNSYHVGQLAMLRKMFGQL